MFLRFHEFHSEPLQLFLARRAELHLQSSTLEPRGRAQANLRRELQQLDLVPNRILGLSQTRKSQSSHLLFDALELIGSAKTRIGCYVGDCPAGQDFINSRLIAQGDFFEPIHQVAQVIFTDLEALSDFSESVPVRMLPVKPALQRPRVKAPG